MVTILMVSAKITTPGLLKISVFWDKGYEVIIFAYDATNKILLRDKILLRSCDQSLVTSTSMRKVIITSILWGFDQKNYFFWAVVLVQVQ